MREQSKIRVGLLVIGKAEGRDRTELYRRRGCASILWAQRSLLKDSAFNAIILNNTACRSRKFFYSFSMSKHLDELERVYKGMADAQKAASPTWPTRFVCPDDCSLCCERTPSVPVTSIEAHRAAEALTALDEDVLERTMQRIGESMQRLDEKQSTSDTPPEKGPCPFLEKGKCVIYDDRPLFCRGYGFSVDEGAYFGCEILLPFLQQGGNFQLPRLEEARKILPHVSVRDKDDQAIPALGPLHELVWRLLG